MEIDKEKLERIIGSMQQCQGKPIVAITTEAFNELKELINPKWEPMTSISEYNQKIHDAYFAMEERNKRIILAKLEKKFGDGKVKIYYTYDVGEWQAFGGMYSSDPELTFETKAQAEEVIRMVGLNERND